MSILNVYDSLAIQTLYLDLHSQAYVPIYTSCLHTTIHKSESVAKMGRPGIIPHHPLNNTSWV